MQKFQFRMPHIPAWNITAMTGYEPKTTFWEDFSIADAFGMDAIRDTFKRAFKEWRNDVVYLAELALVLNHKGWAWYEHNNEEMARLYFTLYEEVDLWASENLKGDDASYYYRTLD